MLGGDPDTVEIDPKLNVESVLGFKFLGVGCLPPGTIAVAKGGKFNPVIENIAPDDNARYIQIAEGNSKRGLP